MSFSSDIKKDVSVLNIFKEKERVKSELIGYLLSNNVIIIKNKIKFSTENEYNINRFNKLLNNLQIDYDIELQGNIYIITFKNTFEFNNIFESKNSKLIIKNESIESNLENDILLKDIIRGCFLGAGSVNNPNNKYHLEIIFSNRTNAVFVKNIINKYEIKTKSLKRRQSYSIYIKEGEDISKFLALIGASLSVIKFEEIRVIKEMRNNVNRIVNCETANINKIVNTSVRQIKDIKLIQKNGKFKNLPEKLQEIASVRLENPNASLIELGQLLEEKIGKSGVNYRLSKISEMADEIEQQEKLNISYNILRYKKIESTQDMAKQKVNELSHKTVIIADIQTKGRGTKDRKWYTKNDKNITMTIILKPKCKAKSLKELTVNIARCIQKSIKDLYGYELKIKEPNDLLLNNKKICGILTEISTIGEQVKQVLIGIGFNVNEVEFPKEIETIATSLKKEYKKDFVKEEIVKEILKNLEEII